MDIVILGDGGLGRAVAAASMERGDTARILGRPPSGRHDPATLVGADVVVEASRAGAVVENLGVALDAGCRRMVLATTGWSGDQARVDGLLRDRGAAAVAASNFSLGVVLFGRLVDAAVELYGALPSFDPYLVEWHRRTKSDRPSGTADDLARRILAAHPAKRRVADGVGGRLQPDALEVVSIRAGASPGMHLVGFDSAGETVELRLTARDRSAYADGILAAADWLTSGSRTAGLHPFGPVVDEVLAGAPVPA